MSRDGNGFVELKYSVLKCILKVLLNIWPPSIWGHYPPKDIIQPIIWATVRQTTIHRICEDKIIGPTDRTIRNYIFQLSLPTLLNQTSTLLQKPIVNILRPGKYKIAIDLTYIPYHGKPKKSSYEIVRSKAKSGTTHFHAYASLYVIKQNKRFTLDLLPVWNDRSYINVIESFITRLNEHGFSVKLLCLDKAFYIVPVIKYLLTHKIPTIIPAVPYGRYSKLKPLLNTNHSYRTSLTMTSTKYKSKVTFPLYIIRKYSKNKFGRSGAQTFSYVVLNIKLPLSRVFEEYRKRFGIESSYRLMNTCRARTTSRDPVYRLFLVFLSFLIMNYWIASRWLFTSKPKKGGRVILYEQLRSHTFMLLIDRAIENIYGLRTIWVNPGVLDNKGGDFM
jgi:putative transposase